MRDIQTRLEAAVRHFWSTREHQQDRQGGGRDKDRGSRAAVTGGSQMDGFVYLVRDLLIEKGIPQDSMFLKRKLELPGWFRAEKKWDLIVVVNGQLVAALEFKSQVGPSFGNNANNRAEEALGSATDIWAAYREGAFKPSQRPWLGYLFLLEDCDKSRRPVAVVEPHFPVFAEFKDVAYKDRYQILTQKLVRERLYDGACFLLASAADGARGQFSEPDPEFTFVKFANAHACACLGGARAMTLSWRASVLPPFGHPRTGKRAKHRRN